MVVVDVNGINVPFYVSTGAGGKAGVATGEWYPIMGIGEDGWFNKSSSEVAINNYYYDKDLQRVARHLNEVYGDLRDDPRIPKVPKDGGPHLDVINRDMKPMSIGMYSEKQFQRNIARVAEGKVNLQQHEISSSERCFSKANNATSNSRHKIFENIENKLGAENIKSVDLTPDGVLRIEVDDTYSRGNLTALGIDNPSSLSRVAGSQLGTVIIEIPEDRLPASLKIASHVDIVGQAPWEDVTRGNGFPAKYLDLDGMSSAEIDSLSESLKAKGVKFDIRDSSALSEGGRVLAVDGADIMKIARMQDGYDLPKEGHARRQTPSERDAANKIANILEAKLEAKEAVAADADVTDIETPKSGGFLGGLKDFGKNSGLFGGAIVGVVVAGGTVFTGGNMAEAAEAFGETAIPYGEAAIEGAKGNHEEAGRAAVTETVSNVASVGGVAGGAMAGAAVGSIIPIVGTAVGAVVGGIVGGITTGVAGAYVANAAMDSTDKIKDAAKNVVNFFSRLNPFSEKEVVAVAEIKPSQEKINDAETPKVSNLDLANTQAVEMSRIDAAWDGDTIKVFYNPQTLNGNKGMAQGMFERAHAADPDLMVAVYEPNLGSPEHTELHNLVNKDSLNQENFDERQCQYMQLT